MKFSILAPGVMLRLDASRRRLELTLLAALAGGCGPDGVEPPAEEGSEYAGITTETDTGSDPAPDICFVELEVYGEGDCNSLLGYRWTTGGCDSVLGCSCSGSGCDSLYADKDKCVEDHAHCSLCDPCPDSMSCVAHCSGAGYIEKITCGGGCYDGEMEYYCPYEHNDQPVHADIECSGLGRVRVRGRCIAPLDLASRSAAAARAWAQISAYERASVDGFERLVEQLEALDAPAELIDDARRFADDERRHADATAAIARALDPAVERVDVAAVSEQDASLEQLLEALILEGCIGETLSALELEHMAAACVDEQLTTCLRAIAADEARHAQHAWSMLGWLLRRFPELRSSASRLLDRRCETVPLGLARSLPEHGLLADTERAELWALGRERVIEPLSTLVA